MYGPQPWAVGETIGLAWEGFKRSWLALAGSFFIMMVGSFVINGIPAGLLGARVVEPNSVAYWIVYGVGQLTSWILSAFFTVGLNRMTVAVARGQEADFSTLFGGGNKLLPYLGQMFLMMFAILIGTILFIVPGVLLSLGLMLAPFYLIDANMGPIDAMKESWNATKGQKLNLFVLGLASVGIMILGMLACCVGYFAAAPICYVALAIVYVRISGRGTATSAYTAPPQYPGYGPGPGGYGQQGPGGYGQQVPGGYGQQGPGGYGPGPGQGGPPGGYG